LKSALSIDRLPSRRLFLRKPPRHLFHYTDLEAVKGILTSKSLWLSKFTSTNDISEIRLAIQHFQAFVEKEARDVGEDEAGLLREAASRLEGFRKTNICLASFCEEDDLLSQWRAYGNDGRGIALGFSTPGLQALARRHNLSLYRCVYDPKSQGRIASDLVKLLLKSARNRGARSAAGREALLEKFIALFLRVAPVIKDHRFGEEREWRLVSEALPYADRGMFPVLKGNQASVKFAIKLANGAHGHSDVLSRITIGPTLDPYNVHDAIELLAMRTGFDVKKIEISGIPFRLLPE
jgi:DUF2971 family protein